MQSLFNNAMIFVIFLFCILIYIAINNKGVNMTFYDFCKQKVPALFIDQDQKLKSICDKMESKINNTDKMLFVALESVPSSRYLSVLWIAWIYENNGDGFIYPAHISINRFAKEWSKEIFYMLSKNNKSSSFVPMHGVMCGYEGVVLNNCLYDSQWSIKDAFNWFIISVVPRITAKYPLICFYSELDEPVLSLIFKEFPDNYELF